MVQLNKTARIVLARSIEGIADKGAVVAEIRLPAGITPGWIMDACRNGHATVEE